jgi:hypothetical protein
MKTLPILLLFLACSPTGDKSEDSDSASGGDADTDTDSDTDDPVVCQDLTPLDCKERSDCVVIQAKALSLDCSGESCLDWDTPSEDKGCMDAEGGCGDAETIAASPQDPSECWWFSSTCIPGGWTVCDTQWVDECPE